MFLSYKHIKHLGYDQETKKYRDEYKIIDSDFEEVSVVVQDGVGFSIGIGIEAVFVETYRKRNLPVAPNLFLCMQYTASQYPYWTIEKQFKYNRQHNPYFPEYEEEINKYLLLL